MSKAHESADFREPTPTRHQYTVAETPSPATSLFASPTFSWVDSDDSAVSEMSLDTDRAGATYDAEAARRQLKKSLE